MRTHPLLLGGLALLFFSGFSAFHHVRTSVTADTDIVEGTENALPLDVLAMVAVSVALILLGALSSIPDFKSTRGIKSLNMAKRDDFLDRPSFRSYNHRAIEFRKRINIS